MEAFPSLDDQGDGFRSFAGVVLSLLLARDRLLLIDEPEAFLHPAQARRLGHWVSKFATEGRAQVIVATHNAHFLAGILSGPGVADIYRLNRRGDTTTYQLIGSDAIASLSTSPLLSSQRVMESVFHRGVVVCEADSDRLLYQTAAARAHDEHEVQFLHAHNKQTLKDVVALLRAAGIPCGAIADLDLLNSEADLTRLVKAFGGQAVSADLLQDRRTVAKAVEGRADAEILAELLRSVDDLSAQLSEGKHTVSGARSAIRRIDASMTVWRPVKKSGVAALDGSAKKACKRLVRGLAKLGVFLVPSGELESWIDVGEVRKSRWIVLALEHLAQEGPPKRLAKFVKRAIDYVKA